MRKPKMGISVAIIVIVAIIIGVYLQFPSAKPKDEPVPASESLDSGAAYLGSLIAEGLFRNFDSLLDKNFKSIPPDEAKSIDKDNFRTEWLHASIFLIKAAFVNNPRYSFSKDQIENYFGSVDEALIPWLIAQGWDKDKIRAFIETDSARSDEFKELESLKDLGKLFSERVVKGGPSDSKASEAEDVKALRIRVRVVADMLTAMTHKVPVKLIDQFIEEGRITPKKPGKTTR